MKLSELTKDQRGHLAWRLDHKTGMGLLTASAYARGEYGDMEVAHIFRLAGKSERAAKIHARKVANYTIEAASAKLSPEDRAIVGALRRC